MKSEWLRSTFLDASWRSSPVKDDRGSEDGTSAIYIGMTEGSNRPMGSIVIVHFVFHDMTVSVKVYGKVKWVGSTQRRTN